MKKSTHNDDLVIIYFSGHGAQTIDTDGDEDDGLDECLVPYDVDINDDSSLILDDLFAYWIRNLRPNNILIIFDNCFSGGAAKQKAILMPGVKGGKARDDFSQDISREVPRRGTALFAACKPAQVSFESDEFKNGLFTHFLIESISSSADYNFNKIIDAQELFYATRQKTIDHSMKSFGIAQEPILIDMIEEELNLFYIAPKLESHPISKKIEELLYKSRQETNFDNKIEILKEALIIEPSNPMLISELPFLFETKGEYMEALYYYEWLYESDEIKDWSFTPSLPERIAELYEKMGKIETAFFWYSKALEGQPEYTTYFSIGRLNLLNKDTTSAIMNFNKSLDIQPMQKDAYFNLFYIHLAQKSLATALKIINDCHNINPNDFQALYWLGVFQKYFNNNATNGDSLLIYFEKNSGITRQKNIIMEDKSLGIYIYDGKTLQGRESQQRILRDAISQYPYYADFYKFYIQFAEENMLTNEINSYIEKYMLYSKLNPDSSFIKKYIK